ncbi:small-conductance mechanosensitive channel [Mucilaginibacter lappiensis]|uniref:Small-conductance mechanosensitive channel n=1 Tax=Mucilaginibacter lappiensis TaxID=354630 RepID=A0A841JLQ5_9SPHI|nr:small-conductance mechanosensitive channel [Mucilaginibacter lappiensis]
MEIPYTLFVGILLLSLLIGVFSYIGFITRLIYLWRSNSKLQKFDSSASIVLLGFLVAISAFLCLGIILPSLNYPR